MDHRIGLPAKQPNAYVHAIRDCKLLMVEIYKNVVHYEIDICSSGKSVRPIEKSGVWCQQVAANYHNIAASNSSDVINSI